MIILIHLLKLAVMKVEKLLVIGFWLFGTQMLTISGQSWQANHDVADRLSKSRPEFNYYEERVPVYTLPEVLADKSGKRINSANEWTKVRRTEILKMLEENVFGKVPSTPWTESFRIVNEDKNAINGTATLKQVEITISSGGRSLPINLTLFIPNKVKKPVPVFLLIDNRGPANTDPARVVKSEFWPVEEVVARGYAISVFSNSDVDPDNYDDFKNGIHGLLDIGVRPPDAWGSIAAWAWGASRCMDYFETDKDIDRKRIAVLGHSRGGKTALWAGAVDQRFAMVIGNESGCGGAAIARRRLGETVARINTAFPHWFCSNYKKYADNENAMPFDMHMLLALVAPRALYIDCASEDLWGDPKGCYVSLYNSLPVFRLLKTGADIPGAMPPLNRQVISGKVGFHIRDGVHDMLLKDWNYFMNFADIIWK
jgi:hypothetical protein